jgi:hypothetical protein
MDAIISGTPTPLVTGDPVLFVRSALERAGFEPTDCDKMMRAMERTMPRVGMTMPEFVSAVLEQRWSRR